VAGSHTNHIEKTVHSRPMSTRVGLLDRLFALWFNSLVYNQIWEDPSVDLDALCLRRGSRVVAIASGGCNVLNYLTQSPECIAAVDINPYHIYLTRLRLAAFEHLATYEDFFRFFGAANTKRNVAEYYRRIREHLDGATRCFWEGGLWLGRRAGGRRIDYFSRNFYNYAKLGTLLRFVHQLARALRIDPGQLLQARTLDEQRQIYDRSIAPFFDSSIVRLLGRQPLVLFSLGIPPRQYEAMRREGFTDVIALYRQRIRRLACDFPAAENYFLWQAVSRQYDLKGRKALPDYLKPEHYTTIKANIDRVSTVVESITDFLKKQPDRSFDRFVLLDSQDWMEAEHIEELWRQFARVGRPGSRIIFRTGGVESLVERLLPFSLRQRFVYEKELSGELLKRDRSAIYGGFHLYTMPF